MILATLLTEWTLRCWIFCHLEWHHPPSGFRMSTFIFNSAWRGCKEKFQYFSVFHVAPLVPAALSDRYPFNDMLGQGINNQDIWKNTAVSGRDPKKEWRFNWWNECTQRRSWNKQSSHRHFRTQEARRAFVVRGNALLSSRRCNDLIWILGCYQAYQLRG